MLQPIKEKIATVIQLRNWEQTPRRIDWKPIRILLISIYFSTQTSISTASTEECKQLEKDYYDTHARYEADALLWESNTNRPHVIPNHAPAKTCEQLQENYDSLRNSFNQFSDKFLDREDDETNANQVREDKETEAIRMGRVQAQENFTNQMDRINKFLNDDVQSSQSTHTKLKAAIENLTALRDLVESDEFPEPWDVSHDQLEVVPRVRPVGGNCTCQ